MNKNFQYDSTNSTNYININQYRMFTRVYGAEKLDTLVRLKDSSKKLIYVLENIQSKSCPKDALPAEESPFLSSVLKPINSENFQQNTITDLLSLQASEELENQLKNIDSIDLEEDDDDCSVYKKLTRKCQCLTITEYNDFVIHFNEDTQYFTSIFGELVKNMRIIKHFLYFGGAYTRNALEFLNEGLSDSSYTNKVEIAQGCAHADVCNIFDNTSIIEQCINIKKKSNNGLITCDDITQSLALHFLFKMARIEEGRRYLNFTSKITHQLKIISKKDSTILDLDAQEIANSIIDILDRQFPQQEHTFYYKGTEKDCGVKAIEYLLHYRSFMTLDEVTSQLEMLRNLSYCDVTKREMIKMLPTIIGLFKNIIVEYDNSEINILTTSILTNIILKMPVKTDEKKLIYVVTDACTEPVKCKDAFAQVPIRRNPKQTQKPKANIRVKLSNQYNRFMSNLPRPLY